MRPPFHRSFVATLLAALAAACQQPAETTAPPVAPPTASAPAAAPTLAQRFSPIVSGSWVSIDYLNELARTRSPKAAIDKLPSPGSLTIAPFDTRQDSVVLDASYNMHEGGNLTLLLQPSQRANTLLIRPDYSDENGTFRELSYRITAGDTLLVITSRRKNGQLISQQTYRRTGGPATTADLETAVNRGVNQLLLARQYRGTDSLGRPVQAQFALDGTVRGLPFGKYLVSTDFTGPNPGDEIIFDVYTKHQQGLAATLGRDTLRLFTTHATVGIPPGGTDTTEYYTRGRLRYQLVRVR